MTNFSNSTCDFKRSPLKRHPSLWNQGLSVCVALVVLLVTYTVGSLWMRDATSHHSIQMTGGVITGLSFAPDGSRLLAVKSNQSVSMIDWKSGRVQVDLVGQYEPLGRWLDEADSFVFSRVDERTICVFDVKTSTNLTTTPVILPYLSGMAIDPSQQLWTCAGIGSDPALANANLFVTDVRNNGSQQFADAVYTNFRAGRYVDVDTCTNAAGEVLLAVSEEQNEGEGTLWKLSRQPKPHAEKVAVLPAGANARVKLSAKWERIAFASSHQFVLYDFLGELIVVAKLSRSTAHCDAISFSSKEPLIAVATRLGVEVRDANTGKMNKRLPGESLAVAFSPDGESLVVSRRNKLDLYLRPHTGW